MMSTHGISVVSMWYLTWYPWLLCGVHVVFMVAPWYSTSFPGMMMGEQWCGVCGCSVVYNIVPRNDDGGTMGWCLWLHHGYTTLFPGNDSVVAAPWLLCGVHVVSHMVSVVAPSFPGNESSLLCGCSMVSMWYFTWCLWLLCHSQGITVWLLCGCSMVALWCPCGISHDVSGCFVIPSGNNGVIPISVKSHSKVM